MVTNKEVVVFSPLFNKLPISGYGATERLTLERAKWLKKVGYRVQLIANSDDASVLKSVDELISPGRLFKFPNTLLKTGLSFIDLKWYSYSHSFVRIKDKLWNAPILSDAGTIDPFSNYFLAKQLGINRLVSFLHGNFYLTNGHGNTFFKLVDKYFKFSYKVQYAALNTRLFELMTKNNFRVVYMPNGLDFPELSEIEDSPENYLIFVGVVTRNKAPHIAIMLSLKLGIKLKIVGPIRDNQYFVDEIKPFLSEQIKYYGEVERTDLNILLKRSMCLIFSSTWNDPQPTVVLEANSYGVPVLAINSGVYSGIYDMIENGKTGYVGTLDELLAHANEVFSLDRKNIYRTAKCNWHWPVILRKFHIPILEELQIGMERTA